MGKKVTTDLGIRSRLAIDASTTAAQRHGQELIASVRENKRRAAEAFFDMGAALLELEKKALWKALGHESFAAMLAENNLLSRTQAFKLMAIARGLPRRAALELGPEKSYALVRYAHATAAVDSPASLLTSGVHVDGQRRSVDDVSVRELQRASRHTHQNRTNARRDPARKSARELCASGAAVLSRVLGERVRAEPNRVKEGWGVTITMSIGAWEELRKKVAKG
jgi:hypothetical protein